MDLPRYINSNAFQVRTALEIGSLQDWHLVQLQDIVLALGGTARVENMPPPVVGLYLNLLLIEHLSR
jgi:hypothetical protein